MQTGRRDSFQKPACVRAKVGMAIRFHLHSSVGVVKLHNRGNLSDFSHAFGRPAVTTTCADYVCSGTGYTLVEANSGTDCTGDGCTDTLCCEAGRKRLASCARVVTRASATSYTMRPLFCCTWSCSA